MSNYQLFSCGTEAEVWQYRNCERCAKSVWYDEETDTYPDYECEIQNEIELAWVTDGCGSKAAHDATQQRVCPHFKPIER